MFVLKLSDIQLKLSGAPTLILNYTFFIDSHTYFILFTFSSYNRFEMKSFGCKIRLKFDFMFIFFPLKITIYNKYKFVLEII